MAEDGFVKDKDTRKSNANVVRHVDVVVHAPGRKVALADNDTAMPYAFVCRSGRVGRILVNLQPVEPTQTIDVSYSLMTSGLISIAEGMLIT